MILSRISKRVLHSIPVLSIFVLLGIIGFSTIGLPLAEPDGEVYAAETTNNTSLIIDNGELKNDSTTTGGTVYSSHTVQVKAGNIDSYSLTISGPTGLSGSTAITGAGNKTLADMADNTWGYAWAPNIENNESTIAYQSFANDNQFTTLEDNTTTAISNNAIDFTKKLVFAAKFGNDATNGHYRANVTLNLAATPRMVVNWSVGYNMNGGSGGPSSTNGTADGTNYTYTIPDTIPTTTQSGYKFDGYNTNNSTDVRYWPGDKITIDSNSPNITLYAVYKLSAFPSSLSTMQGMTPDICASVATGVSKGLTDSGRGNNVYYVQKLKDGNCWMTSNLALDLSSYTLTSSNSDVTSNYTKGTATKVTSENNWVRFDDDAGKYKAQFAINAIGSSYGYNAAYGYYYSWCAATAGTCSSATNSGVDAPSSICPKGWHLPKGEQKVATIPNRNVTDITTMTSNDFAYLRNIDTGDSGTSWASIPSDKIFAGPPAYFTLGGADWYRAGAIGFSGTSTPGVGAFYWSRTSWSSEKYAFAAYFNGSSFTASSAEDRPFGLSIRCIAYSS